MKKQILIATILMTVVSSVSFANDFDISDLFPPGLGGTGSFNPDLVPVEEEPGPDAEIATEVIHEKNFEVAGSEVKLKWTSLGYGNITEKVLIQELAKHSLFNHRNPGEEGPCLRSYRAIGSDPVVLPAVVSVNVKALNRYAMNREKKICKVSMVETVTTTIDGTDFTHTYSKPMGFRYIGDCPAQ